MPLGLSIRTLPSPLLAAMDGGFDVHLCLIKTRESALMLFFISLLLLLLLLLLSHSSCVRLCSTPETAAHHAPLSLGFSSNSSGCLIQVHTPLQHPKHSSLSLLGVTWSPYMPSFLSSSHILDHISLLLLPASPRGLGDQCQDLGAR